jgi:hypothetical protein
LYFGLRFVFEEAWQVSIAGCPPMSPASLLTRGGAIGGAYLERKPAHSGADQSE